MAKTAVINPRRRRRRKSASSGRRRRRRNPSSRASSPRRRSYYGAPRRRSNPRRRPRRRRNPSVYDTSGGYSRRRTSNPDMFDFDDMTSIVPAATGGDILCRWAIHMAGPMEPEDDKKGGPPVPGVKHAIAAVLAANVGSGIIGSILGDASKGTIARHAAFGFAGSLFLRKRFMNDSKWLKENVYLDGDGDDDATDSEDVESEYSEEMNGFQNQSALGAYFTGPDGQLYQCLPAPSGQMSGFQNQSALGQTGSYRGASSFGYRR